MHDLKKPCARCGRVRIINHSRPTPECCRDCRAVDPALAAAWETGTTVTV